MIVCRYGFDGLHCLLRAICEAAETPLGPENGVLGDILHIILRYFHVEKNIPSKQDL